MTDQSKKDILENICRKFDLDPAKLPPAFFEEIGQRYFPAQPVPEIKNRDLRDLVERFGVDTHSDFLTKVDSVWSKYETLVREQTRQFVKKTQAARFDEKTGCYTSDNISMIYPLIATARENNRNLSVLMLDIDNFKRYNSNYGWAQGDVTLRTIGDIMTNIIKSPNAAIRYGKASDEFVIVLPETEADKAQEIAERIRSTVEQTVFKKSQALDETDVPDDNYKHATVTIGVFTYHPRFDSVLGFYEADRGEKGEKGFYMIDKLINMAGQALKSGKNKDKKNFVHVNKID